VIDADSNCFIPADNVLFTSNPAFLTPAYFGIFKVNGSASVTFSEFYIGDAEAYVFPESGEGADE
jgi:hypothetical protein